VYQHTYTQEYTVPPTYSHHLRPYKYSYASNR
jgi:hypothetical protein